MKAVNLGRLKAFVLVVELGSLSKAASASGTTQSYVSRQIAQLETAWGDHLFERNGRGVVLSNFGRRIEPEVRRLLAQAAHLETVIQDSSGVPSGTVTLGVVPSLARSILPSLMADLRQKAPGIRLRFTEDFTGALEEQLASGQLDMAVMNRYADRPRPGEDLLGHIGTLVVGRPGDPRLTQPVVSFKQLAKLPLVLPPEPNAMRSFLGQHSRRNGVELNVLLEVNNLASMISVAESGEAFSLVADLAVADRIAAGTIGAWRMERPSMRRSIALGLSRHHPLSHSARLVASRTRAVTTALLARA